MTHCRLFARRCRAVARYTIWPVAITSSIAEGLTAVPALADVSYWAYQFINPNNTYTNSEEFVKDNPSLLGFIALVAVCGIATDFLLEGYNAIKQVRAWQPSQDHIDTDADGDYQHMYDNV